jgi:predicted enzyme related to lactoylglutathione lyase
MTKDKQPKNRNGKICYLEIPAIDIEPSAAFYKAVFGWEIKTRGDGQSRWSRSQWHLGAASQAGN